MRVLCAFVLAAIFSLLASTFGGDSAAAFVHVVRPLSVHERDIIREAKIVCGMFDGSFGCRNAPGSVPQLGKNAIPGVTKETPDVLPDMPPGAEQGPIGTDPGQGASGGALGADTACQHGMVGTPPNCRCPKSSELLGGNCVHYTASACSNGLASDAMPQACRSAEEKVSCTSARTG